MNMHPLVIAGLFTLCGCSSWPEPGAGGGEPQAIIPEPTYLTVLAHTEHAALLAQAEVLDAHTELLVVQGAAQCIPAAILQLQQRGDQVRRQLAGHLFHDAADDLAVYQHQLRAVQWRFDKVKQQTQCAMTAMTAPRSLTGLAAESPAKTSVPTPPAPAYLLLFSLLFDSNSAVIGPGYQTHLQLIAELLQRCDCELVLEGHTDKQGTEQQNQQLSQQRVEAVQQALAALGVSPGQTAAYGEQQPLLVQHANEPENRRVDLFVKPKASPPQTSQTMPEREPAQAPVLLRQWQDMGVHSSLE